VHPGEQVDQDEVRTARVEMGDERLVTLLVHDHEGRQAVTRVAHRQRYRRTRAPELIGDRDESGAPAPSEA
jgi:hypothetical protein